MTTADPTKFPTVSAAEVDQYSTRMMQFITGSFVSQIVRAFAELSIADLLAKQPTTAPEIAAATRAHGEAITRLLRAGAALGLVTVDDQARFSSTPVLRTLQHDAPGTLRGLAIALASPGTWLPWGNLVTAVVTGERQTVPVHGMEYFEYLVRHPAEAEIFTAAMDGVTGPLAERAARIIKTQYMSVVADIGGASGILLHALLKDNLRLQGIVYDRPNVVPSAVAAAERFGLADRVSVIAGDFFDAVPEADLYLLKWILHDWDDESCIRILANCRRAMRPDGRVAVIELQLGRMDDPGLTSIMDINMMVMLTGRERTESEYGALFAAAGLQVAQTTTLQTALGPWSVIEAVADAGD